MDHLQFKANQTAAVYVADGLDPPTQEAFEMHLMACTECVEDVETWRAIKVNMPTRVRTVGTGTAALRRFKSAATWRMAATLLVGGAIGASAGWFGRATQGSDLDSDRTLIFNLPNVERGSDECRNLRLSPQARLAVLRIAGIARDQRLVAADADRHALPDDAYSVRVQPDGSRLVRLKTSDLIGRPVHLQTSGADGTVDPLGCVTGTVGE